MFRPRLTRLAAIAAAAVLLAGCGSGAKVHLVFFNARGAETVERKLVDRYQREHPNIEIEYLSATSMAGPSDTDAIANLIFNIQAKRVVDVAKIEVSRTPLDLLAPDASKELTAIGGDAVKS